MILIKPFLFFLIVAISGYRGFRVHNYMRRLNNQPPESFGAFAEKLLNLNCVPELIAIVPMLSNVKNNETITMKRKINFLTVLIYILFIFYFFL